MMPTPWIVTANGDDHPLSGCAVLMPMHAPAIGVIAHSLSQINRFNGHTSRAYSVAEHSVLVWRIVKAAGLDCHAQLAALLHDAHEAFCGDMATPIKHVLGVEWMMFENPHAVAVRKAFGIESAHTAHQHAIKRADLQALATERRDLLAYRPGINAPWPILDTPGREVPPLDGVSLDTAVRNALPPAHHKAEFLRVFAELTEARSLRSVQIMAPATLQP